MASRTRHRLSVRAIILREGRLLLVNAWPGQTSDLWCAPGGGVELHLSLHQNLAREVHEETGLFVRVGEPALVNEFHDPASDFHQVDIYFRCQIESGELSEDWRDPEGIVNRWCWVTRDEMAALRVKPDSLAQVVWGPRGAMLYDPLEPIVR